MTFSLLSHQRLIILWRQNHYDVRIRYSCDVQGRFAPEKIIRKIFSPNDLDIVI